MLPNPLLLRWYLSRALRLWVATRAMMSVAFLFAEEDPLHLPLRLSFALVVLSVGVCLLEVRVQHERTLFANLGIPLGMIALLSAPPAIVGETLMQLLARALP
jgi:hypothetical protein